MSYRSMTSDLAAVSNGIENGQLPDPEVIRLFAADIMTQSDYIEPSAKEEWHRMIGRLANRLNINLRGRLEDEAGNTIPTATDIENIREALAMPPTPKPQPAPAPLISNKLMDLSERLQALAVEVAAIRQEALILENPTGN